MSPSLENVSTGVESGLAALDLLSIGRVDAVMHIRLNRPSKRNALNDGLIAQLHSAFLQLPADIGAVVLSGEGHHFCAGLDLSELVARSAPEAVAHSRSWHAAFDAIQYGRVPVVAVLSGAVIGGGLELAAACHLRVAEPTAYFGLPEGQRGLFVGGGGSVRIPRLIGVARMTDMMLTGRVFDAIDGERFGIVNYLAPANEGLERGLALAKGIAANAAMTSFAVMHALPRIVEQSPAAGQFTESLVSAIAACTPEAQERMQTFLQGKASRIVKS